MMKIHSLETCIEQLKLLNRLTVIARLFNKNDLIEVSELGKILNWKRELVINRLSFGNELSKIIIRVHDCDFQGTGKQG